MSSGLVVDLGCGGGRWALELNRKGYEAFGVDQSAAFIRLARKNAPQSKFKQGSLWTAQLPECDAVTAIGECLNYRLDGKIRTPELGRLFARVYRALRAGGVFIFDVAGPGRISESGLRRIGSQGADWAILAETTGDKARQTLVRRIICFREIGRSYRRTDEIHRLQLYRPAEIVRILRRTGFGVECLNSYGAFQLPAGITAFVARK